MCVSVEPAETRENGRTRVSIKAKTGAKENDTIVSEVDSWRSRCNLQTAAVDAIGRHERPAEEDLESTEESQDQGC